ncbi:MAG TPA: PQQ-binding-like beta-propeller repeat protein [Caulobacteraceae bacterium]|nr:PQQ-binding-like beta-propeller repeat protein [Caulobacteraceae bacterium]
MTRQARARRLGRWIVGALALVLMAANTAQAQPPKGAPLPRVDTDEGFALFQQKCFGCHGNAAVAPSVPSPEALRSLGPERIYDALTTGPMKAVGDAMSEADRKMVSASIGGRVLGSASAGEAKDMPNRCKTSPAVRLTGAGWNGWGGDLANTRFRTQAQAGMTAKDLPRLKLKWAFGLPNSTSAYSQPTVVGGRVFIGTDTGNVYALDAETGCVYWSYRAVAGVRVPPVVGAGKAGSVIYVSDLRAYAYALDARTGRELWKIRLETNYTARGTAGGVLYRGVFYVPISSWEEFSAKTLDYGCCTSVGSVSAVDAASGKLIWKTRVIAEPLKPTRKNSRGVQQYGPAGGSVWNTPAIDPQQGAIYFGTGDATTFPPAPTADSVMALDLKTGKVRWSYQVHGHDSYLVGCQDPAQRTDNCPDVQGPDWDIPASVILKTLPGGKRAILVGTKPGDLLALDPDHNGALMWRSNVFGGPPAGDGPKGGLGVRWGGTADRDTVYYGLRSGGVAATRMSNGRQVWFNAMDKGPCAAAFNHGAAATGIPGAVLISGADGRITGLSQRDGRCLWTLETARTFDTVNHVPAHGGSLIGSGVTVSGGMMFIGSGYAIANGAPGNVLLAYSIH